jgi:hypothetical protein
MKITKRQLRNIIREAKARLLEVGPPPDMNAPGWSPNDSQEWERQASYEEREEIDAEKKKFMAKELTRWYDEFGPDDDGQADLIEDHLSDCYDAIYKALVEAWS